MVDQVHEVIIRERPLHGAALRKDGKATMPGYASPQSPERK